MPHFLVFKVFFLHTMPKAKQTEKKRRGKRARGSDGGDGVEERSAEEMVVVEREEREERGEVEDEGDMRGEEGECREGCKCEESEDRDKKWTNFYRRGRVGGDRVCAGPSCALRQGVCPLFTMWTRPRRTVCGRR